MSELDTNSTQQLKTVLDTKSREQLYDEIVSLKGRIAEHDATISDLQDNICDMAGKISATYELEMKLDASEERYLKLEDYHLREVKKLKNYHCREVKKLRTEIAHHFAKTVRLGNKVDEQEKTIDELRKDIMDVANPSSLALEYLRVKDSVKVGLIYSHWAGESLDAERRDYDYAERADFTRDWMAAHDEWIADNEAKAEKIDDLERQISILRLEQNGNIDENA